MNAQAPAPEETTTTKLWTYRPSNGLLDVQEVLWERPGISEDSTELLVQMVEVQVHGQWRNALFTHGHTLDQCGLCPLW